MQQTIEHADRHARASLPAEPDARHWVTVLAPYREPSLGRSLAELFVTVVPFVALWLAMLLSLRYSYWLCLLLAVPAAGFLVRLFMIQHDCGHGSFFRRRRANDWLGRVLGVLTLTPYGYWRRTHAMHHATSGHLDRRGTGDIGTLTVREYQSLPAWRRALYRLKRHPIVLLGLGPFYLFVLKHRLPVRLMRAGRDPWLSVMSTNLAIAVVVGLLVAVLGAARLSAGAGADHLARLVGRRLAVLCAAPVRAHLLGVGRGLEPPHRRPARQLALRSAARAALVHGQHRHPSRPSSVQPDPLLPARRGAARASGAARGQSPDAQGELPLPASRPVGRGPAATGGVPRCPLLGGGYAICRQSAWSSLGKVR